MKYILYLQILFIIYCIPALGQKFPITPFESSDGMESADYFQAITYFEDLSNQHSALSFLKMGGTDSGYPLHLLVYNSDGFKGFENLKNTNKLKILIMNAIHPGEPDGIDAAMMLVRDLAGKDILKGINQEFILMIIPVYNIGGALNRGSYSRANQQGPREYGFRGNSRNLDLNRDFIKMDSKNSRSFARIFHLTDPDIFIDTHVTNGADYPYVLTYIETQADRLGGELGPFVRNTFSPALERSMSEKNMEIIPYVNVFGVSPENGYTQFLDYPRYSTGYTALFGTISYVVETHMLKPFKDRVIHTYSFIESVIAEGVDQKETIKELRNIDRHSFKTMDTYPIQWKIDSSGSRNLHFKGYETIHEESRVSGNIIMKYDRNSPYAREIPFFSNYSPVKTIQVPDAYIIPQAWTEVINLLDVNQINYTTLSTDTLLPVQQYKIKSYQTYQSPYEGHYFHYDTEVSATLEKLLFRKGDIRVPTDQPGFRYILETLEPESPDSFFNWNFFDTILRRKEYFSTYIFDEKAAEIMEKKSWLKDSLEYRKNLDPDFEKNTRAQLEFIYINSDHYEKEHLRYPVFRFFD